MMGAGSSYILRLICQSPYRSKIAWRRDWVRRGDLSYITI
jgi:hypothetical protein